MRLAVSRYFPSFAERCEPATYDAYVRRFEFPQTPKKLGDPRVLDVGQVEAVSGSDAPSHRKRFVIREMGILTTCHPSSSRNSTALTSMCNKTTTLFILQACETRRRLYLSPHTGQEASDT
ncbi:hypothetical protein DMN91_012274 [Ooceraea biroi]|uniref:Uncharacterized protein n=1 Tax=Ooceraea biroi TaxID=2015173 RepID=A0A3L8D4F2_OOCBI|nr:uncharacterized protein LOC105286058 [Ooceraea biroi]RLU15280.1 hypothetical protein DMN91_012274 [Ooceraea biroi]